MTSPLNNNESDERNDLDQEHDPQGTNERPLEERLIERLQTPKGQFEPIENNPETLQMLLEWKISNGWESDGKTLKNKNEVNANLHLADLYIRVGGEWNNAAASCIASALSSKGKMHDESGLDTIYLLRDRALLEYNLFRARVLSEYQHGVDNLEIRELEQLERSSGSNWKDRPELVPHYLELAKRLAVQHSWMDKMREIEHIKAQFTG